MECTFLYVCCQRSWLNLKWYEKKIANREEKMLTIWDDESDDDVKNISDDCAILFVWVCIERQSKCTQTRWFLVWTNDIVNARKEKLWYNATDEW